MLETRPTLIVLAVVAAAAGFPLATCCKNARLIVRTRTPFSYVEHAYKTQALFKAEPHGIAPHSRLRELDLCVAQACSTCKFHVNACVLHICVAHVSPHVHIRVFHVYTYVCYKSTQKFVLVKQVCVIQVCTSVAREHKCLFQVSTCMGSG